MMTKDKLVSPKKTRQKCASVRGEAGVDAPNNKPDPKANQSQAGVVNIALLHMDCYPSPCPP